MMPKIVGKAQIYSSIKDFDIKFLPEHYRKNLEEKKTDPRQYGIFLASKVLRKVKLLI
jgi:hypothetical protein